MEEKMETDNQSKLVKVQEISSKLMPNLPYHNFGHALDVFSTVTNLAELEKVSEENKFLLQTAALLHDVLYIPYDSENEERGAKAAIDNLPQLEYLREEIVQVTKLIMTTKYRNPKNLPEMIICDADLDNLGREDFIEIGHKYRIELGLPAGRNWDKRQLNLLQKHCYYTESARRLRNDGLQRNIAKLRQILEGGTC